MENDNTNTPEFGKGEGFYRGNTNLIGGNYVHKFTAHELQEYEKCMKDPIYFINNYIKVITLDHGLQQIKLHSYQEDMIRTFTDNRYIICKMARQSGKALDLNTPILTPNGMKKFADIHVGDQIYGPDGKLTTVTFETPVMYNHNCYKVTFDNGETIIADEDHLWEVYSANWRRTNKAKIKTTKEILELLSRNKQNGQGVSIRVSNTINFDEQNVDIDPYTLGLWLGDGSSRGGVIYCQNDDYLEYKKVLNENITEYRENTISFRVENLHTKLRLCELLENKHIPDKYIFNSVEVRQELIRGLMDSDGTVDKNGHMEFYQKDEPFIDRVRFILETLGVKVRKRSRVINNTQYFTLAFTTQKFDVFKLPRKLMRQYLSKNIKQNNRHYIQDIIPVESVPVKCIQVNNNDHMFLAGKHLIPTHNTVTTVSFLLHYILFNSDVSVAIAANKEKTSHDILERLKLAFENLPPFLQQGVVSWNKGDIRLANNSRIVAAATSSASIRGQAHNILFLDEFAFVPKNIADDFYASTYPVISSGKQSKIIMVSTPCGMNHFYKFWKNSEEGKNDFKRIDVHWSQTPGRDDNWKAETIRNTSVEQFDQEFNVEFLGSAGTLIAAWKLRELVATDPIIRREDGLHIWENPKKDHTYVVTVDTSQGLNLDSSAFIVTDVTEMPYKVVATFQNNKINPMVYPNVIEYIARTYNHAFVLVEINDVGIVVANSLHYDFEYENLIKVVSVKNRLQATMGYRADVMRGLKTTTATKRIMCSSLKTLVENNMLLFEDDRLIEELKTYIVDGQSYAAEEGYTDDLVMAANLFAWLADQKYFKALVENDVRARIATDTYYDQYEEPSLMVSDGLTDTFLEDEIITSFN